MTARRNKKPCATLCQGRGTRHKVTRHKVTRHKVTGTRSGCCQHDELVGAI